MAWFGVGSGSGRAKPERARGFEQADGVVVEAFADLHEARHLRSKFPAMQFVCRKRLGLGIRSSGATLLGVVPLFAGHLTLGALFAVVKAVASRISI